MQREAPFVAWAGKSEDCPAAVSSQPGEACDLRQSPWTKGHVTATGDGMGGVGDDGKDSGGN